MSRTITTEVVRDAVTFPRKRLGEPRDMSSEQFDRWLAEVERAAAEKAWDEREQAFAADLMRPLGENLMREATLNPYRKVPATGEGNE